MRLQLAALLLAVTTAYGSPSCDRAFVPGEPLLGSALTAGVWADFNGDGVLDFVSTFGYNAWAWVRHGEAFEERTSTFPYPIDHYATPVEAIDVDGDGFLDTVDNQGHVAFGNGYGDFTGSLNRGPGTIGAFIDLDGDGRREYIGATDSSLDLYRFNADRTFTQIKSLPAIMYPLRIVAGDFDGDGRTDFAVLWGRQRATVSFFWNDGSLNFTRSPSYDLGLKDSTRQPLVDLDGDGIPELVNASENSLFIVSSPHRKVTLDIRPFPFLPTGSLVGMTDLDGDGLGDLVMQEGANLSVIWGAPNGKYADITNLSVPGMNGAVLQDWDHDGIPEILAGGWNGLRIIRARHDRQLHAGWAAPNSHAVAGDFDGDGKMDLVTVTADPASPFNPIAVVYLGNGRGGFRSVTQTRLSSILSMTEGAPVVADFDGDGRADVAIRATAFGGPPAKLIIGWSDGTGSLTPAVFDDAGAVSGTIALSASTPRALVATSSSGLSIVTFSAARSESVTTLPHVTGYVALADAAPASPAAIIDWSPDRKLRSSYLTSDGWKEQLSPAVFTESAFAAGDVDGDGISDLVQVRPDWTVTLLGQGNGSYKTGPIYTHPTTAGFPHWAVLDDVDGDGLKDLITVPGPASPQIYLASVFRNTGGGSFTQSSTALYDFEVTPPQLADFNGDGHDDLMIGSEIIFNDCSDALLPPHVALSAATVAAGNSAKVYATSGMVPQGETGQIVMWMTEGAKTVGAGTGLTITFTTPPLSVGTHTFVVHTQQGSGPYPGQEAATSISVTAVEPPQRRRGVRP